MKSLCVLFVLCVLCVNSFGLDRTAFTFTHYELEVRIDPNGHAIAARGKIRLRNDSNAPQRNLTLQISSSLAWRMIELNGKPVQYVWQPYSTDIDHTGSVTEAVVTLPSEVSPKETVELEVGYHGQITRDATRLTRAGVPAETAAHNDWDQVAEPVTAVRGIGYVAWYPVSVQAASLSDNSLFGALDNWKTSQHDTTMQVNFCWVGESDQTVIANGRPEGVTRHVLGAGEEASTNTGCSKYVFAPVAGTVPTFAVAEYAALLRPAINVYHLPAQGPAAQEYALAAEKVLPFETEWFGAPKSKVSVVQLPDIGDAPFESGPLLFTPLEMTDRNAIQIRMMHQLLHASFTSPRPWINEGLAHFAQALQREQQGGRAAAISYMQTFLPALQAAENSVARGSEASTPSQAAPGLITSTDEVMYRVKAMYVWWMLRDITSDAALQQAIRKYRVPDDKDTSYMPRLIEQAARRDLAWFFDDWVYRDRGLPDLRVEAAYPRVTLSGSSVVTVTVANDGEAAAEVPVIVRAEGGQRQKKLLVKGKNKAVERIEVPTAPIEAVVNDGSVPESKLKNNSLAITAR
jgi:aminopeptidase N